MHGKFESVVVKCCYSTRSVKPKKIRKSPKNILIFFSNLVQSHSMFQIVALGHDKLIFDIFNCYGRNLFRRAECSRILKEFQSWSQIGIPLNKAAEFAVNLLVKSFGWNQIEVGGANGELWWQFFFLRRHSGNFEPNSFHTS